MPTFTHPTSIVELEGTFIVRDDNLKEFVYLSEVMNRSSDKEIYDHRDILIELASYGIEEKDLEFTKMSGHYSSAFMDA